MSNIKICDEYCLEVKGNFACFNSPEFKVERVSYPVITPSAARGIFDAILWKPAMRWQITKIEVLNPIQFIDFKRNEVAAKANTKKDSIFCEDERTQKTAKMLRDVRYRIWAKLIYIPINERPKKAFVHAPDEYESEIKYHEMFQTRTRCGMQFHAPYLGTRECAAIWRRVEDLSKEPAPIKVSRDLGLTFYDWDYDAPVMRSRWFFAEMKNGVITVPSKDNNEIL